MVFLVVLCLSVSGQDNQQAPSISERTPSVQALESEVLEHRRRIQQVNLEFDSLLCVDDGCRAGNYMHSTGHYYLDGKKKRFDSTVVSGATTLAMKDYSEVICFSDSVYIYHANEMAGAYPISVNMFDFDHVNAGLVTARVPDARAIGMAPATLRNLIYFNLESFVGRTDKKNANVSPSTHKGIPCWLLRYTTSDKFDDQLYIAPSMDYSVIYFKIDAYDNSQEVPRRAIVRTDVVDTEMAKDQASGLWFPKRAHYRAYVRGELQREERLTLNVKSLNQDLDPSYFTLSTMDVKPGTHIQRIPPSPDGELYWDGTSIKVEDASGDTAPPPPPQRGHGRRWFLIANALIFAIVAVYLLVKAMSRKSKEENAE